MVCFLRRGLGKILHAVSLQVESDPLTQSLGCPLRLSRLYQGRNDYDLLVGETRLFSFCWNDRLGGQRLNRVGENDGFGWDKMTRKLGLVGEEGRLGYP